MSKLEIEAKEAVYFNKARLENNSLKNKTIAIIGAGAQGSVQYLNLSDSSRLNPLYKNTRVIIGARDIERTRARLDALRTKEASGHSGHEAGADEIYSVEAAIKEADVIALLLPDEAQASIYATSILPHLNKPVSFIFAHGFSIAFEALRLREEDSAILVAPKGTGVGLREAYIEGRAFPLLVGVDGLDIVDTTKDSALDIALAYADMLGRERHLVLSSSFKEECIADLFSEQSILCGGLLALIESGFETLVAKGISPEGAYFECLHEVKLIADLLHTRGVSGMAHCISNAAFLGMLQTKERFKKELAPTFAAVFSEIEDGSFARALYAEAASGYPTLEEFRANAGSSYIEQVGSKIREKLSF